MTPSAERRRRYLQSIPYRSLKSTNTFSAEYGRNTGSVVNLWTKSGSNRLHGSLYEFFRNDALDARNFFNDSNFAKSALHLNQFGGTLGGPIVKSRTFFFLNYEGFRRQAGITRITNVPTTLEREGQFLDNKRQPDHHRGKYGERPDL